jgi:hypothetical protein
LLPFQASSLSLVFEGPVAATEKKTGTQPDPTASNRSFRLRLGIVVDGRGCSCPRAEPGSNRSQPAVLTSLLIPQVLQISFILHVIYLVHNKSGACPKNNGLDGQGFINIDPFAHVCTCVVQVNDNATCLFVCAIVIASSTLTTTTTIDTAAPVALPP